MRCHPETAKAVVAGMHKTDIGGVLTGLHTEAEVVDAFERLSALSSTVLICEQVPAGVEVIVGASRDPEFGPVLMCGLGGSTVTHSSPQAC